MCYGLHSDEIDYLKAHVEDMVALDLKYLKTLPHPVAPWGQQGLHDSNTGIFRLGGSIQRKIEIDPTTNESVHPSVLQQEIKDPTVIGILNNHPELIRPLLPLEDEIRETWKYVKGQTPNQEDSAEAKLEATSQAEAAHVLVDAARKAEIMGKDAVGVAAGVVGT